jgi:indole-3-glycerol phosphate synthase
MTILESILARKVPEVAQRKRQALRPALERRSPKLSEVLSKRGGPTRLIAEIKRKSPSKGMLNAGLDVTAMAQAYVASGAHAISVLTDQEGFGGTLSDLETASRAVSCPLLRKDFVVDAFQIEEAHRAGAAAVLLIVAALERARIVDFLACAKSFGLDALVEVHDEAEVDVALSCGAEIVGINNRNLHTFQVDLATTERLVPRIDGHALVVSESGVSSHGDIVRLRDCGVSNFLVGELLVKSNDVGGSIQSLVEGDRP